jgi:hypothetical protein
MERMRHASLAAAVWTFALAACSGSSAPAGSQTSRELQLVQPPLATPLAAGQSTTLSFREVVCHFNTDSRGNGEHDKRCDAAYTPQSVTATAVNPPPPFTSQCTISSTSGASVTVTKTAMGTTNAWCTIDVRDPATNAGAEPQV